MTWGKVFGFGAAFESCNSMLFLSFTDGRNLVIASASGCQMSEGPAKGCRAIQCINLCFEASISSKVCSVSSAQEAVKVPLYAARSLLTARGHHFVHWQKIFLKIEVQTTHVSKHQACSAGSSRVSSRAQDLCFVYKADTNTYHYLNLTAEAAQNAASWCCNEHISPSIYSGAKMPLGGITTATGETEVSASRTLASSVVLDCRTWYLVLPVCT